MTGSVPAARVVQISDTHLSRRHHMFQHNWDVLVSRLNADPPDLIVCTGDMSYDGAGHDDDLVFAREQFARLDADVLLLPGNYDIGNSWPDVRGTDSLITDERRQRYMAAFGEDYWARDLPGWRLVGLNSMLMGSGFEAEISQTAFLRTQIETLGPSRLLLFMHKPLYYRDATETEPTQSALSATARASLRHLVPRHPDVVVSTGHLHSYRTRSWDGIEEIWCPSTAFVMDAREILRAHDGERRAGYLELELGPGTLSHGFVEPDRFLNIDLVNWFSAPEGFHKRYDAVSTE